MKENIVICPVYNEGKTIYNFYQNLREYFSDDIVFIDDGSTDNSQKILHTVRDNNTFILSYTTRQGYGAALNLGFTFALDHGYKRMVTIDADLQHDPKQVPEFINELMNTTVVLGSRYLKGSFYGNIPRDRFIINRYISRLLKNVFSFNCSDPFCGLRGYNKSFLEMTHFNEKSYGLGLEILMEMIRNDTPFKEIYIEAVYVNPEKTFLDGLDDSKIRLLYYLNVISQKKRMIEYEKKVFIC